MGVWVFVRLEPYRQTSLKISKNHKLAPKFYSPYQVRKRVGQVAYALDIPNKGKIHDVFHVSCLKKKLGSTNHIQTELPMLDDEVKLVQELECILEIKTRTIHSRSVNVYLIKRINLPDDEATWENEFFFMPPVLTNTSWRNYSREG